jgi:hypothetical protein
VAEEARHAGISKKAAEAKVDTVIRRGGWSLWSLSLPDLRAAAGFRFQPDPSEAEFLKGLFRLAQSYKRTQGTR